MAQANAPFAIFAVKPHFIYMYCTIVCPASIILHIAGLEITDIFYMVATENFPFLVDADAFITHKAVAFKAVIFQSFLFVAGSTMTHEKIVSARYFFSAFFINKKPKYKKSQLTINCSAKQR